MIEPTRILGSSEEYGSWNISCRSRRCRRSSPGPSAKTLWPSSNTVPEFGRSSATTTRPIVVLPQPDSPTRPNVSPAVTVNETLDTACTLATWRWRIAPAVTGNSLTRSRTSSSGTSGPVTGSWPSGPACWTASAAAPAAGPFCAPAPGPSTGCQQENRCPAVSPVSGGSCSRHLSLARLHRGANRQPSGGRDRSGGSPPIVSSRRLLSWLSRGIEASSA